MSVLLVKVERVEDLIGRVDDYFSKPKQKQNRTTHADKLRAMSDEELAEFYCNDVDACPPGSDMKCIDELYAHGEGPYPSDEQCRKCWLDWLKQEAEA